jgi:signal transduction histidine kinase
MDLQRDRIVVRTELSEGLPAVRGDRVQLQQVLLNFLRNAGDAMKAVQDRPRHLLLRTSLPGDGTVLVSVRDSGEGFDGAQADRLFDPFYTTKADGMGIGLSVSRTIIQHHEGRIGAAANDGPGATFWFAVPLALPPDPSTEGVLQPAITN